MEEAAKNAIFANAIFANAILAMETSGHGALRENYFLDDGAYIIVKLLVALVESAARRQDFERTYCKP